MLQDSIDAVQEFHIAKGINFKQRLMPLRRTHSRQGPLFDFPFIGNCVTTVSETSQRLLTMFKKAHEHFNRDYSDEHFGQILPNNGKPDYRFLRASLVLEEAAAELITALFEGDEAKLLDAMADAIYVINGTAVTYDLPLNEAFKEVHRSNMTKAASGPRLQDKGSSYRPPDFKTILENHRNARFQKH